MAVMGLNLLVAHTLAHRHGFRVSGDFIEFPALDRFGTAFRWVIWVGVLFVGYIIGQWGMTHWLDFQMATHGQALGQAGPALRHAIWAFIFFNCPSTGFSTTWR